MKAARNKGRWILIRLGLVVFDLALQRVGYWSNNALTASGGNTNTRLPKSS